MCKCHGCGKDYKVDILVPDWLWEKVQPEDSEAGAGLLCGPCIAKRIENIGDYMSFALKETR